MRRWCLVALPIAFPLAADPVTLHVDLIDGRFLTFELQSHYETPVTKLKSRQTLGTITNSDADSHLK
jgi:hypothetical protein